MTATLTFHPLGNADSTRIDLADGRKMLIDYADMRNDNDPADKRIDLPTELKSDLRAAKRNAFDVVIFTHLDDDHCCGAGDFFGGAYDNLGLERVWKRCRTILVSNAGKTIPDIGNPTGRWIGQAYRTLSIVQQQAENLRRRLLFGAANAGQRRVAYWSIDTPISAYCCPDALAVEDEHVAPAAAAIRTRLNSFTDHEIELLLRVGYAGADASLRTHGFVGDTQTPA